MRTERWTGGPLSVNCYLLTDEDSGKSALIDPGYVDDRLLRAVEAAKIDQIWLTHGHFDHIAAVEYFRKKLQVPVLIHAADAALAADPALNGSRLMAGAEIACTVDHTLQDGETVQLGNRRIQVLHTPGHTAGGCCYCTPETVFTGDTLMYYSIGRCDLPTGDEEQLMQSLKRLAALPGNPRICGGHGLTTMLQEEKQRNPFLR